MNYMTTKALVFLNTIGQKMRVAANKVVNSIPDVQAEIWLEDGSIREATIGEVAEAVAAGETSPEALAVTSPAKAAAKRAADAKSAPTPPAKKADAKSKPATVGGTKSKPDTAAAAAGQTDAKADNEDLT